MTNFEAMKQMFERMTLEDVAEFLFEEPCGKCAYEETCAPGAGGSCIEGHKRWLEQETNG